MIIRIYETKNMDLDTVENMLFQADKQANFHPDSSWTLDPPEMRRSPPIGALARSLFLSQLLLHLGPFESPS